MIRQKLILGNYTYIVDLYKNKVDLKNPTYKQFYILRDQDFMSGVTNDKHIYFIDKEIYNNEQIIYPLNDKTHVGYSLNPSNFNLNMTEENLVKNFYQLYTKVDNTFEEANLICDMVRIYFPIIKPKLDAVIDIENFINDIKIHYLINNINNYSRKSNTEFSANHNLYSEYIDIYIPSLDNLLFNENIYIADYNNCINDNTGESYNVTYDNLSLIPFNILYYPYKILKDTYDDKHIFKKSYIKKDFYINTQFYSTLNVILYPYTSIDDSDNFILNSELNVNATHFNLDLRLNLSSEIKFPVRDDFKINTENGYDDEEDINSDSGSYEIINEEPYEYDRYYGVPCGISRFMFNNTYTDNLEDFYLGLNGYTIDDYLFYDSNDKDSLNYKDEDNEYFGEKYSEIIKTGFYIEMSTDKNFSNIFFKYNINIKDQIIDDLIFPLNNIFKNWEDVPSLIIYRVTFIDKVACIKIVSNPVIITDEWYKYLVNAPIKNKLKFNKVYKKVNNNMIVGKYNDTENPILFIDKINCTIKKEDSSTGYEVSKKSSPKVIYKPVFYRTQDLQNINIKKNIVQNIGINLDEYMTKVETFKLIIEDNEYIEYGRNNIFVIFNINGVGLKDSSGKYIITNENNEYISDGQYIIN